MVYQLIDYNQNLSSSDNYSGDRVGLRNYKCVGVLTWSMVYMYSQAPPQPCSVKNKIDYDNIEIGKNSNNIIKNKVNNKVIIIIIIMITMIITTIIIIAIIIIVPE